MVSLFFSLASILKVASFISLILIFDKASFQALYDFNIQPLTENNFGRRKSLEIFLHMAPFFLSNIIFR